MDVLHENLRVFEFRVLVFHVHIQHWPQMLLLGDLRLQTLKSPAGVLESLQPRALLVVLDADRFLGILVDGSLDSSQILKRLGNLKFKFDSHNLKASRNRKNKNS